MEQQIDLFGNPVEQKGDLKREFGANPFTILDTKDGLWQARKRKWINLGIQSEVGRDAATFNMKKWADRKREEGLLSGNKLPSDTSIFDPTLCEIMYRWFCPENGKIIDPFAGGSVRGIVANYLGYHYTGVDIRKEQVDSNYEQSKAILDADNQPEWIEGDSNEVLAHLDENSYDMLFTCPPYADLEVYSNIRGDISNMKYDDFIFTFESIMRHACKLLKKGSFAVIVVGEVRDKNGNYYGFVPDTIKFMQKCRNMHYYNEAILATSLASAALRAGRNMKSSKLVKTHQNIIIFKKE